MSRRPPRPLRLAVERLEERLALAAGIDPVEVYTWQLINTMRANPAQFADQVQALHDGKPGTFQGYAATDPVWTDIRSDIDQNAPQNGWSLASTLAFMRAQPALPPLFLQEDLTARAADHTLWMEQHGYAHTGTTLLGSSLPGTVATPAISLEAYNHDATRYGSPRGENINYGFNTDWAFQVSYQAGTLTRDGYTQQLAYVSAMSFILDVGLADLGHLRNLFGRPDGVTDGTTGPLAVTNFDSIGISEDLLSYLPRSDVANFYVTTMRFDNVRNNDSKAGQYAGLSFTDSNHNGLYDIGETYQLTASATVHIDPGPGPPTPVEPAPHVAGLRSIRTRKQGLTAVVVGFDEAVDFVSANNLGAYALMTVGAGKKFRPRSIRLVRADYDLKMHTVTLTLLRPYKLAGPLRLTVATTVVSSPSGVALGAVFSGAVPK